MIGADRDGLALENPFHYEGVGVMWRDINRGRETYSYQIFLCGQRSRAQATFQAFLAGKAIAEQNGVD